MTSEITRRLEAGLAGDRRPSAPWGEEEARQWVDGARAALTDTAWEARSWHRWLSLTSSSAFLSSLADREARHEWAEVALRAIRASAYDLRALLDSRVDELGDRIWLEELRRDASDGWSYAQLQRRIRGYAAALCGERSVPPRVALLLGNSVAGACADLACLTHGCLVAPLSVHFDVETLVWIFDRLGIEIAITDSDERVRRLGEVRTRARRSFELLSVVRNRAVERGDVRLLDELASERSPAEAAELLEARPRPSLDDPCTVMFTSGSTGRPRGVVFTSYHLVAKRFARAAALPQVGNDETLLCYLPLFHTFGRYLELQGSLFWRGRYVLLGSPAIESLLEALPRVRPTGLVGIPLRWSQIAERVREVHEGGGEEALRSVVGDRLRWGLSAAGYLSPRVFRSFHRHGVSLCSGFGMTEATGGITMSPPDDYRDGTVGVPLPGIEVRLSDAGEMHIAGPYVARYLKEDGADAETEPGDWLATGDLFARLGDGHLAIVDRIKDIYKNSRGQTIAPRRVEERFEGVPGIRRTFLVGDHRAYNVLLIVPDREDPVFRGAPDDESRREYYKRIVAAANEELAPFERVVELALLDRDFEVAKGELTPKGSFRRKAIEESFGPTIAALYRAPEVVIGIGALRVVLPRWLFRDLGILESDVVAGEGSLVDRRRGRSLEVLRAGGGERVRIGSLEYRVPGDCVDLGVLSRQPLLWAGNPALIDFAPCKAGWDVDLSGIGEDLLLPLDQEPVGGPLPREPVGVEDSDLLAANAAAQRALFGRGEEAQEGLRRMVELLAGADFALARVLRSRITALARHPEAAIRQAAYREALLDEPRPDGGAGLFSFIESGLPFLDEASIAKLAARSLGSRRLEGLRRRFLVHRRSYPWPAAGTARDQFEALLRLLRGFAENQPAYHQSVRQELASWAVLEQDPYLARRALELMAELDDRSREKGSGLPAASESLLVFDADVRPEDRETLRGLFLESDFLELSVCRAFETRFGLGEIGAGGVWVSRHRRVGSTRPHRVSVNTREGRHFDLLVTLFPGADHRVVEETVLWTLVVGGHTEGTRVMPRLGCLRGDREALSLEFVDGLSAGEQIRQRAAERSGEPLAEQRRGWRLLFVRALATFFRGWEASDRRIVPGILSPRNVVVPERDFHEGARLLSLAGWVPYERPSDLVAPLLRDFFLRSAARYPVLASVLDESWLFDAVLEGLGSERGEDFLLGLQEEVETRNGCLPERLGRELEGYRERRRRDPYLPLPLENAIARYHRWCRGNPGATAEARGELLGQLGGLYHLDRFGESARYLLFRRTAFAECSEKAAEVFDRLLEALPRDGRPAAERVELFELQGALVLPEERELFGRLVFPHLPASREFELMTVGESDRQRVTVRTHITDARGASYEVREPLDAEETGTLYRLFFLEGLPKAISELDRHLVAVDATETVVAGLSYKPQGRGVVHMDGVVVKSTLLRRGVAHALVEDLASRLDGIGVRVLKTNFIYPEFLRRCGFRPDRRWGGLVRFLGPEEEEGAATLGSGARASR